MISDNERREVARRLRGLDDSELQVYDMTYFEIQRAVGGDSEPYLDGRELTDRLADLIEPSEPKVRCVAEVKVDSERLEKLVHDVAVELTGIDRDALLELADALSRSAETGRCIVHDSCLHCPGDVPEDDPFACYREIASTTASRIREALGVQDA